MCGGDIKMPQQIVYTDEKENKIVEEVAEKERISKADAIKKIIREYKNGNNK